MRRFIGMAICVCSFLLTGCGSSEPQPIDIHGTATFDGKPIVFGTVEFIPDSTRQMSGPAGNAEIVDGKFDTSQAGRGVFPGAYLARVTAYEERTAATSNDETVASNAKPPIFVNYDVEVVLGPDENVIEVPASAAKDPKAKRAAPAK